jgi:hypothetical protein
LKATARAATRPGQKPRQSCTLNGVLEHPAERYPGARLRREPPHYPFAPTEFPTGRSAAQQVGRQAPSHSVACTPQEEDTGHRSRPKTATGLGLPPSVFE